MYDKYLDVLNYHICFENNYFTRPCNTERNLDITNYSHLLPSVVFLS